MPTKRRRRSAGDIQPLERFLEHKHGLSRPSPTLRRANSYTSPVSTATPGYLSWNTMALSRGVQNRVNTKISNVRGRQGSLASARKRWWITSALSRRQVTDLKIKLRAHYNNAPWIQGLWEPQNVGTWSKKVACFLIAALRDTVRDLISVFLILWSFLWPLIRWPCFLFVAVLLCLQILAMAYTATSETFLSSFCRYRLPIVRDLICREQDLLFNNQVTPVMNLNQPFNRILESKDKTISYELPHYLQRYETGVRKLRATLPEAEYNAADEDFFHTKYSFLIDQCGHATTSSQNFHSHITGTINSLVSDTRYVMGKLDAYGFLGHSPVDRDGFMARMMAWLNSYYLVYLPVGIEPFQQSSVQANIDSFWLIQEHLQGILDRLQRDIDLILVLQEAMLQLVETSEAIFNHVSLCKTKNMHKKLLKSGVLRWTNDILWGQTLEDYQIGQRDKWLDHTAPVFEEAITFLGQAVHELTSARQTCQFIIRRVESEGRAAKYGRGVSEWVREQVRELDDGLDELEAKLKAFRLEKLRFQEGVFKKAKSQDPPIEVREATMLS
ncbi:MAG: hypothetical protein L6R42_000724 [Xanthoria sp. 1 TBL-2021]|nr:MAG: hypothetical protein L6R42_000724 [Xanthoria sp. 1 TBL-2021]